MKNTNTNTNTNTVNAEQINPKTQGKIVNLYLSIREHANDVDEKAKALAEHEKHLEQLESTFENLKTEKGKTERLQAINAQKQVVKDARKAHKQAQKAHENAFTAFEKLLDENHGKLWTVEKDNIVLTSLFCSLCALKWLIKADARYDSEKAYNLKIDLLYHTFNGLNVFTDESYIEKDASTFASDLVQEISVAMLVALADAEKVKNVWRYARNRGVSAIRKQISVKADLTTSYGVSAKGDDESGYKFTVVNIDKQIDKLLAKDESTIILSTVKAEIEKHKDADLIVLWSMLAKGYSFQKMADELQIAKSTVQRKIEKIRKVGQTLYPNFDPTYLYIECADSLTGQYALAVEK